MTITDEKKSGKRIKIHRSDHRAIWGFGIGSILGNNREVCSIGPVRSIGIDTIRKSEIGHCSDRYGGNRPLRLRNMQKAWPIRIINKYILKRDGALGIIGDFNNKISRRSNVLRRLLALSQWRNNDTAQESNKNNQAANFMFNFSRHILNPADFRHSRLPHAAMLCAPRLASDKSSWSRDILLGAVLIVLGVSQSFATDIVVNKSIVSYIVTLNSITPAYLPKGSGAQATIELTITPTNRAKYTPKTITMYANNIAFPIDINSYSGPGTYTTTLDEGIDLPDAAQYQITIAVDNAISNALPVTVWRVISQTVSATPANTDRKTLGIGEEVQLAIAPPLDISGDDISWSVDGGYATLSANKGYLVTFAAGKIPLAANVSVMVDNGSIEIPFNVIAPESISVIKGADVGYGIKGPPNNMIGAYTTYKITVNPTFVSFYRASFQENIPAYSVTWPSGAITPGAVGSSWSVAQDNTTTDDHKTGFRPIGYLIGPNLTYVDFGWANTITEEYLNVAGNLTPWGTPETRRADFRGSDQAGWITYQGIPGGLQGPWQ